MGSIEEVSCIFKEIASPLFPVVVAVNVLLLVKVGYHGHIAGTKQKVDQKNAQSEIEKRAGEGEKTKSDRCNTHHYKWGEYHNSYLFAVEHLPVGLGIKDELLDLFNNL